MGYESRIYVVNVNKSISYGEVIARFDLSKIGNGFSDLFKNPVDFHFYAEDGDTIITKDSYGDEVKTASIQDVIEWLETKGREIHYRRIEPLIGLLKGFDFAEWEDLRVVHYGY